MLVGPHVFRKLFDPVGQDRNLDFGRPRIAVVTTVFLDEFPYLGVPNADVGDDDDDDDDDDEGDD